MYENLVKFSCVVFEIYYLKDTQTDRQTDKQIGMLFRILCTLPEQSNQLLQKW